MIAKSFSMVVLGVALIGCTDTRVGGPHGQTHWLRACSVDADCGGLSCLCGACGAACEANACDVSGLETQCFASGSDSVRAMCEPERAVALCLEPCDGDCKGGQSCIGGACVSESIAQMQDDTAGPDAGGAGSAGSTAGSGATNADGAVAVERDAAIDVAAPGPDAAVTQAPRILTPFAIGLANTSDLDVVAMTAAPCDGHPAWFSLSVDGEQLNLFGGCDCTVADSAGNCPPPDPNCMGNGFTTLSPGEELKYDWDGTYWRPTGPGNCTTHTALPSDTEISITACWLDYLPTDEFMSPPPNAFTCATRMFMPGSDEGFWMPVGLN